jgi:hypothetical protein
MGHHIIPQFYLRGFASQEKSKLWMYEKGGKNLGLLPIKTIAQANDFYGDKEGYLASEIEHPANETIRKIRNKKPISFPEKKALSKYVYMLWRRVPESLKRLHNSVPAITEEVLNTAVGRFGNSIKDKARTILEGYKEQVPKEVWLNSLIVGGEEAIHCLSQMTWIFVTCKEPDVFLASDNPVFIHSSIGINKRQSEMTFPISKNILLLAVWWSVKDCSYAEGKSQLVIEANRRVAHNATRFIFSPLNTEWIVNLLNKKSHQLRLISARMIRASSND